MAAKEKCPKCGGEAIALAKDGSQKRFCQAKGCMHVWAPMSPDQVKTVKMQNEMKELSEEVIRLRSENEKLKKRIDLLAPPLPEEEVTKEIKADNGIFE